MGVMRVSGKIEITINVIKMSTRWHFSFIMIWQLAEQGLVSKGIGNSHVVPFFANTNLARLV